MEGVGVKSRGQSVPCRAAAASVLRGHDWSYIRAILALTIKYNP